MMALMIQINDLKLADIDEANTSLRSFWIRRGRPAMFDTSDLNVSGHCVPKNAKNRRRLCWPISIGDVITIEVVPIGGIDVMEQDDSGPEESLPGESIEMHPWDLAAEEEEKRAAQDAKEAAEARESRYQEFLILKREFG